MLLCMGRASVASKPILSTGLVVLGSILIAGGLIVAFGVARLPARGTLAYQSALPPSSAAWLDHQIGALTEAHPKASAFRLISDGVDAFASRALSARRAERSLD